MASKTIFKYNRVKEELEKINRKLLLDTTSNKKYLCVAYNDIIEFKSMLLMSIIKKYNLHNCKEIIEY